MLNLSNSLSHRQKSAFGLIVLALILVSILAGSGDVLNKERVEILLQRFGNYVQQEAVLQDKEAKFTYGSVVMEGWGFDTRAIISDISLEMSQKRLLDTSRLSLSTQSAVARKGSSGFNRIEFEFKEPINIIENSQLSKTITPSAAITYAFAEQKGAISSHVIRFPEQLIIAPVPAAGDEEIVRERMIVSFGKDNYLKAEATEAGVTNKIHYYLPDVKIVSDNNSSVSIAEFTVNSNVEQLEENKFAGRFEWRATDLVIHDGATHSKPYSLIIDSDFSGAQVKLDYFNVMPGFSDMDFTVHKMALIGENFNVIANGKASLAVDDPLPSGNMDIEIVNADGLIASDLISEPFKNTVRSALKRMSGVKDKDNFAERTSVAIKREKNGVLYIGGITFEELTASLLGEFFKLTPPSEPAADVLSVMPVLPEDSSSGYPEAESESPDAGMMPESY
ncbi:MAG: hypothetical protein ACK502_04800 [Alphaproteobacteria bacterium]